MRILFAACLMAMAASCGAPEAERAPAEAPAIAISDAWASPTPPGVAVSAGYLTITNTQASDDALLAVSTARASRAEAHEMAMEDGVMRMRAVDALSIPAGGSVTLAPGGLHLMFYDVAPPFTAGESIDVTLRFEHAGEIIATLPVRPRESAHGGH